MHLNRYHLRNFRRLEDVEVKLEKEDTIFVGANNSGKTSATAAFRLFVSRRGNFSIYDFSSSLISKLDHFGESDFLSKDDEEKEQLAAQLPAIELDLWFDVSATTYGRVAYLLPSVMSEYTEVGVRIRFTVKDAEELYKDYHSLYLSGPDQDGFISRTLSYFLSQGDNLKGYFGLQYFVLEKSSSEANDLVLHPMEQDKGRRAIDSLLNIKYVTAQRNIDDSDSTRSNRLSAVFASYYKQRNFEKPKCDNESIRVIDESNLNLTRHYETQFSRLIKVIKALGFPGLNDRALRIVSNLNPEQALSGNTAVTYVESGTKHELPEAYNGLGFKNLIYIAIQIANFQIQWAEMEGEERPLCQLIFIEEPEVHLHPQVQQTFIRQIRNVMQQISEDIDDSGHMQQLVVTTHSSHIVAEASLEFIRYFRRTRTQHSTETDSLGASEVLSLANFNPEDAEPENLEFLRKYITLTHCDLFFADAAILVEGTVERLLMPMMIENVAPELKSAYLTVLELGGAYAHRFVQLLKFINLPTLVITDLDSVDPASHYSTCRADYPNAVTSNASIKELTGKRLVSEILKLSSDEKSASEEDFCRYITFQQPVPVPIYGKDRTMIPRTFEEAFICENIASVKERKIDVFVNLSTTLDFETDYDQIHKTVSSKGYKKVEFALSLIETKEHWFTPAYIVEGLKWLSKTLGLEEIKSRDDKSNSTVGQVEGE
jgi:predicted ATP-dependent endonuclease of OLD family